MFSILAIVNSTNQTEEMTNDIENHMVLPQAESVAEPDEDEAYEILRQQEIDDARAALLERNIRRHTKDGRSADWIQSYKRGFIDRYETGMRRSNEIIRKGKTSRKARTGR